MCRSLPWLFLLVTSVLKAEVIDVSEGTNLSLAVHPQNEFIAVDLLGGLWRLPVTGGGATALVPAGSGVAQPRFDPDGETIVFQRWLNGQWDIWQLNLASGRYEALTDTPYNEREPDFSINGREVVFAGDRNGRYSLWSLDLESQALRQLTDEPSDARFPTHDSAGALAYVSANGNRSQIKLYTGGPRGQALDGSSARVDAPSWRPGGGVLIVNQRIAGQRSDLSLYIDADEPVWRRLTTTEDVFVGRAGWLSAEEYVYAADGALWRRRIASTERTRILLFAGVDVEDVSDAGIDRPLDAPGPHQIAGINGFVRHQSSGVSAFTALGDLWIVNDGDIVRLTDDDATDAWPQFSPDGRSLVFASDRSGGIGRWRIQIDSGQMQPVPESSLDAASRDSLTRNFDAQTAAANSTVTTAPALPPELAADRALRWQPARAEAPLVIQAGKLFDGVRGEYQYHVDIHIDGQRITDIVSRGRLPLPDRVIDVSDSTIVPGLIDVHAHLATLTSPEAGKIWLRHGVTTVRDVTADWRAALERAETWASGQQPGPRLIVAPLERGAVIPIPARSAIVVSTGRRILGGVAHAFTDQWARDGETPIGLPPVLLDTGVPGAPRLTLSTLGRTYNDVFGQIGASNAYLATGLGALETARPAFGANRLTDAFQRIMQNSGRIAIGSDAPAVAVGAGFHDELGLLADRGVPADQILRFATASGAIALGLSLQLGTLEAGRLADLLVIDGDPLSNLDDLQRIEAVVVGGIWHDSESLTPTR